MILFVSVPILSKQKESDKMILGIVQSADLDYCSTVSFVDSKILQINYLYNNLCRNIHIIGNLY